MHWVCLIRNDSVRDCGTPKLYGSLPHTSALCHGESGISVALLIRAPACHGFEWFLGKICFSSRVTTIGLMARMVNRVWLLDHWVHYLLDAMDIRYIILL